MDPYDVDVEDKVDWSSRTETIFIRIVHDHVKKEHYQTLGEIFNTTTASGHLRFSSSQVPLFSDEDRELEKKFLGHGVHVYIEDDDSMEPLSETRTEKRHCRQVATSTERGKKNKSEFDSYFKMASSVMNARMEMVKCKSAESTSQCIEKWSIEECIEAGEKLGDIDGDTYNKLMDKLVPSIEWRKAFLSMPEHRKKYWLTSL
ncbi:hypothetical protein KPL71_007861 [Citrus sinensis]|uniref:Uncharacterized protein n=1 Tax=Citrus sinensis TaxID=2711 RepID=A0ACB8M2H7_CITSI|nr:hypothetical protein KPL71_007861 [Citrus sinensis]